MCTQYPICSLRRFSVCLWKPLSANRHHLNSDDCGKRADYQICVRCIVHDILQSYATPVADTEFYNDGRGAEWGGEGLCPSPEKNWIFSWNWWVSVHSRITFYVQKGSRKGIQDQLVRSMGGRPHPRIRHCATHICAVITDDYCLLHWVQVLYFFWSRK